MAELKVQRESWPLVHPFTLSRGSRTSAEVVVAELQKEGCTGRGECVPYPRYGESVDQVVDILLALVPEIESGLGRNRIKEILPPGAARNALDCAFWDLEAKRTGVPVYRRLGLPSLHPVTTAYTLSLDTPENMGRAARRNAHRPLLKCKLAGEGDVERVSAVRESAPRSTLIVDANESWPSTKIEILLDEMARLDVALIEQPLPAGEDALLAEIGHPVPLCADESCHTSEDLEKVAARYEVVNVKLDKTGGLTEALDLVRKARRLGLRLMVGCMVGTSLSMAPALLLAQDADFVDLDGPLLLARDRKYSLHSEKSLLYPPASELWG